MWVFFVPTCSDSKGQLHALGVAETGMQRLWGEVDVICRLAVLGRLADAASAAIHAIPAAAGTPKCTTPSPSSNEQQQVPQLVMFTTQQLIL